MISTKKILSLALACIAASLAGCSMMTQPPPENLLDHAEFATGVPASDLTVVPGSVKNEFVPDTIQNYYREEYAVQDKKGQVWRCSYTYIVPQFVPYYNNDIVCNQINSPSKPKARSRRRKSAG